MALVAVRCGGGGVTYSLSQGWSNRRAPLNRNASLSIGGGRSEKIKSQFSISSALSSSSAEGRTYRLETKRNKRRQGDAVSHDNVIDEWMRHSVVEIVKNLREAPLLVHVYSDRDGGGNGNGISTRLRTEKASPEDWLTIKTDWENGTTPKPEGVIFVEQLRDEGAIAVEEEEEESETSTDFGGQSEITRAWGVVVQGRGENCRPACYLLKTSRVGAGPGTGTGLGMCCMHFCLVKVKSFRETAEAQFKNCWLLDGI
ncbi:hypothetical protein Ddye_032014 [Dipteronia dyeriana]|uniref:DUF7804 domain-containing protein n=1 Tax=Dipteronia dyeriana TaxID=168575 RepID=A0AAD9TJH2_9ROSI|nr:hypothetical protein Ddye_032014 [Dipteronia dyeriana]